MRSPSYRFHPLLYILMGLLLGGGAGFIFFWGFPSNVAPGSVSLETSGDTFEVGTTINSSDEDSTFGVHVGAQAPDFVLEDVTGDRHRLSDLRGEVVLLNFWGTWCGPCRVEMPLLESIYQEYNHDDFVVLAINDGEPADWVSKFGEQYELSFPLLLDPGRVVQRLYGVRGYPSSVFVGRDGEIKFIYVGIMQEGQLVGFMDALGFSS
ncbi:MAG: redoxin domain-containing protein [Anaerolineales bacterium]|jgi:peroxiredoxin